MRYFVRTKSFSFAMIDTHRLTPELAEKLGVQGAYIAVTTVKLVPRDNKMDLSFKDQRFKNLESRVIKELPELTKGSSIRSAVETKKLAFIVDDNYKLIKVVIAPDDLRLGGAARPMSVNFSKNINDIRKEAKKLFKQFDPKATDKEIEKLVDFGLGLAANPQDLIDTLKEQIANKKFSEESQKAYTRTDLKEVTFKTSNPQLLLDIVNAIGNCGNGGHSFTIVIDPDMSKADGGNIKFNWDGDGSDYVEVEDKTFSESREKVSAEMLEKAKTDGVVQKKPNGSWGIISIDAGEWWTPDYESKEKAENALAAYHANK